MGLKALKSMVCSVEAQETHSVVQFSDKRLKLEPSWAECTAPHRQWN